ncbi:MAG: ketoacyl-ACP synthase III [Chitinophagales bacterium]|jgi:3-oxoacyl-[acyl-carrier-protein] synthase-3|nr:ketoacyl-ACP synthase III [Chitinophagales bacterium]
MNFPVITGVGAYYPEDILTNDDISKMVETNDEWIVSRTGIRERRILKDKPTSYMAVKAIENLLEKTNTKPEDIDLLILTSVTGDRPVPCTANIVMDRAGLTNAYGFDFQAACSGFVFGLEMAKNYCMSGRYKKIILLGADKMSSITNYEDRNTCILFGDAAGCVLIEPSEDPTYGIIDTQMHCDNSGLENLNVKNGGSEFPLTLETLAENRHYIYQEGAKVFVKAVKGMADVCVEMMERNQITKDTLDWIVPHQANKRIIDATRERAGVDESKVMINIQKYGNTTNATIPLAIWEYEGQLKKGDNLIACAFGAGYNWGGAYIKWAYDPK